MSDTNQKYKIDRLDFGLTVSGNQGEKKPKKDKKISWSWRSTYRLIFYVFGGFLLILKSSHTIFSKIKWKVSRSIFLGRGIYFKYISNLSLFIIAVFGTFVYMGYEASQTPSGFFSKYSGIATADDDVQASAGGETILSQKQFNVIKYTVSAGDTLSSIAQKFSTADNVISVDSIKWANNLQQDFLKTGQVLDIPPVSGTLHTVQKGDTVISIAKKYNRVSDKSSAEEVQGITQEITDINYLDVKVEGDSKNPVLVEGQKIIVPGGVIIPETPKVAVVQPQNNNRNNSGGSAPNIAPVKAVTGELLWPVIGNSGSLSQGYKSWHTAIDIADSRGPNLVAIANGTVESAGWESGGGANVVRIRYDNGYSSLYAHLASFNVSRGQRVNQGDVIGRMGCTGACTGTHVHFSLFYNGAVVNPCNYFSAGQCTYYRY